MFLSAVFSGEEWNPHEKPKAKAGGKSKTWAPKQGWLVFVKGFFLQT